MDDWSKEFFQMVDETIEAVDEVVTEVVITVETAVADFQKIVVSELDDNIPEWREWFDIERDLFSDWEEIGRHTDFYDVYPVIPSAENQPACVGCCHYHGQVYNGNLLVCGMHPSGWEDEKCPDWESD
jgi:hypothetical protein